MHEPAMSDDDDDGILHFTITTVVIITLIIDHLQRGVVYNFSAICLSVCLYVCQRIIFGSLDIGSLFSYIWYSRWNVAQVRVWSSGQGQVDRSNRVENPYSRNVTL